MKGKTILILLLAITILSALAWVFGLHEASVYPVSGASDTYIKSFSIDNQLVERSQGQNSIDVSLVTQGSKDPGCSRNINGYMSRYFIYEILYIDGKVYKESDFTTQYCEEHDFSDTIDVSSYALGQHTLDAKVIVSNKFESSPAQQCVGQTVYSCNTNLLMYHLFSLASANYASVDANERLQQISTYTIFYDNIKNSMNANTFSASGYSFYDIQKTFVICSNGKCENQAPPVYINVTQLYINVTQNCQQLGCPTGYSCMSGGYCVGTQYVTKTCVEIGCPSGFSCDSSGACLQKTEKSFFEKYWIILLLIGAILLLLLILAWRKKK